MDHDGPRHFDGKHAARSGCCELLRWSCKHNSKTCRRWDFHNLNRVERTNKNDAAKKRRCNIVKMPSCNCLFTFESAGQQFILCKPRTNWPDQRICCDCSCDSRCCASTLTARKWKTFLDCDRDARMRHTHSTRYRCAHDRSSCDRRSIFRRICRQLWMTRIDDRDACSL